MLAAVKPFSAADRRAACRSLIVRMRSDRPASSGSRGLRHHGDVLGDRGRDAGSTMPSSRTRRCLRSRHRRASPARLRRRRLRRVMAHELGGGLVGDGARRHQRHRHRGGLDRDLAFDLGAVDVGVDDRRCRSRSAALPRESPADRRRARSPRARSPAVASVARMRTNRLLRIRSRPSTFCLTEASIDLALGARLRRPGARGPAWR